MENKVIYGQYFTTNLELQEDIRDLINVHNHDRNESKCLEPSCGAGHLVNLLESLDFIQITAIEKDDNINPICSTAITYQSFFKPLPIQSYDLIVGNPPYVKYGLLGSNNHDLPKESDIHCGNLYMYFIERAITLLNKNGVLIFVLPKECLTATRGGHMRDRMYNEGTITHYYDYQEKKVFDDASPQVIILRYQKDNLSHKTIYINKVTGINYELQEHIEDKKYVFYKDEPDLQLSRKVHEDYSVCVGIVSGCNKVFRLTNEDLNNLTAKERTECVIDVLCSNMNTEKHLYVDNKDVLTIEKEYPNVYTYMKTHENLLRKRKIIKITDKNWYKWGAIRNLKFMKNPTGKKYIYVKNKSRKSKPFWIGDAGYFDGSILALCPKNDTIPLEAHVDTLNSQDEEYVLRSILTNTKYSFTQSSVCGLPIS